MIHYIKIKNFGPYRDEVDMNFETVGSGDDFSDYIVTMPDKRQLLKLAYIYGPNASGKTTVLKAFEFLRKVFLSPLTDKSGSLPFEPFLFEEAPYGKSSVIELSFYVGGIRYVYEMYFGKESVSEEKLFFYKSAKPTELFSRTTNMEKRLAKLSFGNRIKIGARDIDLLESHTLHNNTVFGAYSKANVDIPELELLNKWFSEFLMGMVTSANDLTEYTSRLIESNEDAKQWINTLMNKADRQLAGVNVFDRYTLVPSQEEYNPYSIDKMRIRIPLLAQPNSSIFKARVGRGYGSGVTERKIDFVHRLDNNNSYELPIQAESSGTKRYFGLGGLLYELTHSAHFLCIDELETSLHPDLMLYFLQAFLLNAKNSQLLITTHNQMIMENTDFMRRDALWFSEKNRDGSASLYSAADFDSAVLRKDASVINAYRSGKLGGKPNLGSPFLPE